MVTPFKLPFPDDGRENKWLNVSMTVGDPGTSQGRDLTVFVKVGPNGSYVDAVYRLYDYLCERLEAEAVEV